MQERSSCFAASKSKLDESDLVSKENDNAVSAFLAEKYEYKFAQPALADGRGRRSMTLNALVWYDTFSSFAHARTKHFKYVRNKSEVMSLHRKLDALFCSVGVHRAKDELAAEFLIRRASAILTNGWKGTWAQPSHIGGLEYGDLMKHDHCFQVEWHTKLLQGIYKSPKGMFQRKSRPPNEEWEENEK